MGTGTTINLLPVGSEEWLTTEQTTKALGKALRTVQDLAASGKLRWKLRHRPGTKPERLYDASDVAQLAPQERPSVEKKPRAPRGSKPEPQGKQLALAVPEATASLLKEMVAQWHAPKPVELVHKLWLSLDEAAEYSGLARTTLLDLIGKSKLVALKSGGWKIQRKSLESFKG